MRNSTICILTRKNGEIIEEICLAMKKRGFGKGRWNGVGGKVKENETIVEAVFREANEEIGVDISPDSLVKVAELEFRFPHNPDWDQLVHVYLAYEWTGEPTESEEMKPKWFTLESIPYQSMWPDDKHWLPLVLKGKKVKAKFVFREGDIITHSKITPVQDI